LIIVTVDDGNYQSGERTEEQLKESKAVIRKAIEAGASLDTSNV